MNLVPLALVLPLLAAAVLGLLRSVLPRLVTDGLALATAATVTVLALVLTVTAFRHGSLVYWFGGWRPAGGVSLGIDFVVSPFSGAVATLAGVLTTASFGFAWRYFDSLGTLFPTLVLVFLAAMIGYCFSGDLFTLFVFFELMSTCAYALTGYKIEAASLEGAFTFAIVNSLGALLFLWGLALLYGRFGALNLAQLGVAMAAAGKPDGLDIAALALLATGFLVKAAGVPFHFWHADADAVAPTPVCVLISGIMAPLGLYGLARVYWTVFAGSGFPAAGGPWTLLLWLGAATALLGAVMAARQRHLKRLLAFSTISHVGMMLAGMAGGVAAGLGGMLIYLVGHGLVKAALFLAVGIVLHRLGGVDIPGLYGRGRGMVWTATLFVLGAAGLAGLPPFATFAGKALMEHGARGSAPWLPWLFMLTSALTAAAVLRAGARIFLGWGAAPEADDDSPTDDEGPETERGPPDTPWPMKLAPAILIALAAGLGMIPYLTRTAAISSARFLATGAYRALILHGTRPSRVAMPYSAYHGVDLHAVIAIAATAVLTLGFAATSLFGHRLPAGLRHAARLAQRPVVWLETLHNGDVRDYVAWLALGTACLGAGFAAFVLGV